MAADFTETAEVVVLGSGFATLPVLIPSIVGVVADVGVFSSTTESGGGGGDGGDGGGGDGGSTRPTSGMLYPRGF